MPGPVPPESSAELSEIFSHFPDAVRLIDRDLRVILQNRAAGELLPDGLAHLCAAGRESEDARCPACHLAQTFREGRTERWTIALTRPGQPEALDYYEFTHVPVRGEDDSVSAVLELVRDQTAVLGLEQFLIGQAELQEQEIEDRAAEAGRLRERTQSLEVQLDKLRQTQAEVMYRDRLTALGRLVAGVAHEVHTPLGAVISSADLLHRALRRLRDGAAADRLDALVGAADRVLDGSARIERVMRKLRVFSRLDEAPKKPADLNAGLDATVDLLDYLLEDRICVVREYGALPDVPCRHDALNQVFMNLVLNAIQAIPGPGEIRIRTSADGPDAVVEISDNGVGISEADLPRIFESGFTTKSRGTGMGMGLAICKRVVEEHGGTISVVSERGGGTTFSVRLPLRTEVE